MISYFSKLARAANDNKASLGAAFLMALGGCSQHNSLSTDTEYFDDMYHHEPEEFIFTDAYYSTYGNVIVIHEGMGGLVVPIIAQYQQWANEGKYIVVDGQVASADAFGAFSENLEGQTCYTENVIFSPHAASFSEDEPDPVGTNDLATMLVDPLEIEFRNSAYYTDHIGVAEITVERLRQIYPQGECTAQMRAYALRAPNF
jgi:hypothetical protein